MEVVRALLVVLLVCQEPSKRTLADRGLQCLPAAVAQPLGPQRERAYADLKIPAWSQTEGPDGELLTAFSRWFEVLILVNALPGCRVLMFIIGWSYQYLAMLLIRTMAFQLRIRENRALQVILMCAKV